MKNMFENAYFDKPYRTRNRRKAIYIKRLSDCRHQLVLDDGDIEVYDDFGKRSYGGNGLDIVSEWPEEIIINEEELDELAETEANNTVGEWRYGSTDLPKWSGFKAGFKVGLRKALERINQKK